MRTILIKLRKDKTQVKVAKKIGITQKHLSAIETGTRNPSVSVMKSFEKYYGISMIQLFPDIFLDSYTTKRSED